MKTWRLIWGTLIIFTVVSNICQFYWIHQIQEESRQLTEELPKFIYQVVKDETK